MNKQLLCSLAAALLTACAAPATHVGLPLQQAWFQGRLVDYVTTDISDGAMARALGVNHVPALAQALAPAAPGRPRTPVERVYKFADGEQLSVFPSVPRPVGGENRDAGYSPLWALVEVRWRAGSQPRLLASEEAILEAEQAGELALRHTGIVVNCPVVRVAGQGALRDLR
ncbi:hypothetical protein [Pelomonas sp. SE-A7]|uniref:DUF7482 domain-containing protein n=1 Tax=Pelomonas sp. SE-A7 TaxID=3054953 RepID=UPI00259C6AC8|nr:hypothetical protein [Pelomonas sp. SE-A7]MDM4768024.1 hypothetical protein [Pelomonas sp. SE-A7]